jgi:hypothetical protein
MTGVDLAKNFRFSQNTRSFFSLNMEVSVSLYHFRVNIFAIGPFDSVAVRCRSDKILLGVTTWSMQLA